MTIMRTGLIMVAATVCAVAVAYGQPPKPVCAYSSTGAPAWVQCGAISADATDDELREAQQRSAETGFTWIVQMGFTSPVLADAGAVAAAYRERFERFGVWPYVVATTWGEEWHERCLGGEFAEAPLFIPAWSPACGDLVVQWLSVQHARMKAATGKPVLWVTGMVVPGRLVPASTDAVAIDYYPQDGQPFSAIEPVFVASGRYTTLPLALVMRWFKTVGPHHQGDPTAAREPAGEWAEGYARLAQHPRVIALIGFVWASRPRAHLVGLADMPKARAAVERALGVK